MIKAAYKDIGKKIPEYVAVLVRDDGDQIWQSSNTYLTKNEALEASENELYLDGFAHEIVIISQLQPNEGIEDAVERVRAVLTDYKTTKKEN